MTNEWWPRSLAHIPKEDPWAHNPVTVAEIKTFEDGHHVGYRVTISALVPLRGAKALLQNLAALDHEVRTSGPRPYPDTRRGYRPHFWVEAYGSVASKYEPLVLSWRSHDHTVFFPDPGFLMTYGLVSRVDDDGNVCWDDPTGPVPAVVQVGPPSVYSFPTATRTSVTISKDYLQDYLSLRKMRLAQSFFEQRYSATDAEIEAKLSKNELVDLDTPNRRLRLFRMHGGQTILAGASGARLVASPGAFPISDDPLEKSGLVWPGFEGQITHARAMAMQPFQYVYVDDGVLGDYEGRQEFRVQPESGAVSFGTQWSVSYCNRVGRNLIRVELKKLYEGAPPAVTRNWHRFAVDPVPTTSYPEVLEEQNVAKRAKALVYQMVSLGENLIALAKHVGPENLGENEFTALKRDNLDYSGWWNSSQTEAVARHVPLNIAQDGFLDRCLNLDKLLVEGLVERSLRSLVQAMGVPPADIKKLGTLKLLDYAVRLCQVAHSSGLNFGPENVEICARLSKEGTVPQEPIRRLFALHDLRILKAHTSEGQKKLAGCLKRFGIALSAAASGYGRVVDRIYDGLIEELTEVNVKIEAILSRYSGPATLANRVSRSR